MGVFLLLRCVLIRNPLTEAAVAFIILLSKEQGVRQVSELNTLNTDIKKLYGVGKVRAATYAKMGIQTVGDLLAHYPRGYENRGDVRLLKDTQSDSKSAVLLTVATEPRAARLKNRMTLLKFRAYDESGICEITYFNQEYLKGVFAVGGEFRFYGKVQRAKNGYAMTAPAYEPHSVD